MCYRPLVSPWVLIQPFFGLIYIYQNMNVILWVSQFKKKLLELKSFMKHFRFIDDLCALNDGKEFQKSYKKI